MVLNRYRLSLWDFAILYCNSEIQLLKWLAMKWVVPLRGER